MTIQNDRTLCAEQCFIKKHHKYAAAYIGIGRKQGIESQRLEVDGFAPTLHATLSVSDTCLLLFYYI